MDESVGIYALDPGTTSAVARGIFPYNESVWEGIEAGKWDSWEVNGTPGVQAWEIMGEYMDWSRGIFPIRTILVFEDFVVRLGSGAASRRELLDPVRVTSGCETLCWTRQGLRWAFPEYQPTSDMLFATNARLRAHGMWVKGSDHRRDAVRHMIKKYGEYIQKNRKRVRTRLA
jgi:hypothetical protein